MMANSKILIIGIFIFSQLYLQDRKYLALYYPLTCKCHFNFSWLVISANLKVVSMIEQAYSHRGVE